MLRPLGVAVKHAWRVALSHRGVDSAGVFWILLVALSIVGGLAAVGIASSSRKRLGAQAGPLQLGGELPTKERTVAELRVNDVVTIDHEDYLCEGTIHYDEDGHRWIAGRCVDKQVVKWLVVGIDRAGAGSIRVLVQDDDAHTAGYPPEAIIVGETRYALDKRGTATCTLYGDLGGLGGLGQLTKGRPVGHAERCRWWLYSAPGDATLLVEQWGADYRTLRGTKVSEGAVELMQAS